MDIVRLNNGSEVPPITNYSCKIICNPNMYISNNPIFNKVVIIYDCGSCNENVIARILKLCDNNWVQQVFLLMDKRSKS